MLISERTFCSIIKRMEKEGDAVDQINHQINLSFPSARDFFDASCFCNFPLQDLIVQALEEVFEDQETGLIWDWLNSGHPISDKELQQSIQELYHQLVENYREKMYL